MFASLVLATGAAVIFLLFPWFHNEETMPWSMGIVCASVFLLSLFGGIFMTEPIELGAQVSMAGQQLPDSTDFYQDGYARSRAGGTFHSFFYSSSTYNGSSASPSFAMPKCSGKSCSGLAMLFLIVCGILVILASFFVPHFWVAGSLIFLVYLWMLTVREFYMVYDYGPSWTMPSLPSMRIKPKTEKRKIGDILYDVIEDPFGKDI